MVRTKDQYPRRNEYGDSSQICEWCGKRINLARMWRQYGTYCSLECQAAGRPSYYHGLIVLSLIGIIASVGLLVSSTYFFEGVIILVVSFVCLPYSGMMVRLGSDVIRQEEYPVSEDEINVICTMILDVIQHHHKEEGISRKVIVDDLSSCGFNARAIKLGIEHLLVEERIKQLDFSHYKLN